MNAIALGLSLPFMFFILFVLGYSIAAFLLSIIPKNPSYKKSQQGIKILVMSNGVHADFVLPAHAAGKNWWATLSASDFDAPQEKMPFLAFGWGDRGFYLDTPTWAELTLETAANAVLVPSPTVVHVTAYQELPTNKFCETLYLQEEQYLQLCEFIESAFAWTNEREVIFMPGVGYTPMDNFYEAVGSYHCFNTCNAWINRGLSEIGIRTAVWSPLDKGIFYQLSRI